ncbi:MAG: hypothetical protein JSW27_02040 [Phycisphaerales bacterium]|nr:MAG: hypothetical protein JSW27_02040 [Phycisphaerales bacterium]
MASSVPPRGHPPQCPLSGTGAQIVVDALLARGVDTVFGYTGAAVLPLFDRLNETNVRFIVPCHEQGGCHMADAYARASATTGVIIATSGPEVCKGLRETEAAGTRKYTASALWLRQRARLRIQGEHCSQSTEMSKVVE